MTGLQRYPGASTAEWYGDKFPGSLMNVNVVVLHTTEGRTLPDYSGGAEAPTLTAVPDFAARVLRWYQHFDIDRSARALVNSSGGVETNTLNVAQVELVGTCDPATHAKWTKAGQAHVYWPEAPEWALAEVAAFLRWMNVQHGVPLTGPSRWPAYPTSYGSAAGQRMTFEQWTAFKGVCGHMHVPENFHGDPGSIDFPRLIALAKGTAEQPPDTPTSPSKESDVPKFLDENNPVDYQLAPAEWENLAIADAVIHAGPCEHSTVVHVLLEETPADTVVEGRFFTTDAKGGSPSAYLAARQYGGGGHQFVLADTLPAGKQLRFQLRVKAADDKPVRLLHRTASGPYWATS